MSGGQPQAARIRLPAATPVDVEPISSGGQPQAARIRLPASTTADVEPPSSGGQPQATRMQVDTPAEDCKWTRLMLSLIHI